MNSGGRVLSSKEWMLHVFRYYARFHANSRTHQFWLQDNHPIALVSPKLIWQKVDYSHQNPVRAGKYLLTSGLDVAKVVAEYNFFK